MKFIVIATTVLHLAWGASIVDVSCPDSCTCQVKDDYLETSCVSYEFIKKLLPKQESTIVRLNINNAALVNVDLKLKYLKNLHSLDLSKNKITVLPSQFPYLPKLKNLNLSSNHLTEVLFSQLPKNLEIIDLSHNSFRSFPKDWSTLKHLKTLHFHDNPIECDCDNLSIYEQLLKGDIILSQDLTCSFPKELQGQLLNSINCSLIKENLLNAMLGDENGSGEADLRVPEDYSNSSIVDDSEEFIKAEGINERKEEPEEQAIEEGSGDEGSGMGLITIPIEPIESFSPKACLFNCSTPRPVGENDEKNASPLPSIKQQAEILFEDIFNSEKAEPPTTVASEEKRKEEPQLKEEPTNYTEKGDKEPFDDDVVTFPTNDTVVGEMERASFENTSNQSVYIIVGLLIAFVAFLLIYYLNKKKNQKKRMNRKRNKSNENGFGEEMKPLGKSAEVAKPVEEKNAKVPNSETSPLLNGQNGKITEENNVKPHPVIDESELENVELRKPDKQDTLTPQPERVTIKAGELPDSVPKTPLLVHRQLNSDGEIVTTALNSN